METTMEHKFLEPIELNDAEFDVISGGSFVGIKQSNKGGNIILKSNGGGGVFASSFTNNNSQYNTNYGSVVNSGAVYD
jgi:hypothetical protein